MTDTVSQRRGLAGLAQQMQQLPPVLQPKTPPTAPPGWTAGPPDFVGVGTMRSGTSWWWSRMVCHPGIALPNPYKEAHFFDHYGRVADVDPAEYHRYFPRPSGTLTGEWTPRYIYDFWTPPMLRRLAPAAKILVSLRDPVERYLSALAFAESRGFAPSQSMLHYQYERSLYGRQLQTLLAHFPREQVLVLQYERCVTDIPGQIRRTLEFLGLDPADWRPGDAPADRVNAGRAEKPRLDAATRAALETALAADLADVLALCPELDPGLWPSTAALRGGLMG